MKVYTFEEIKDLWWKHNNQNCLECEKGKLNYTGKSPQGGWVTYYTCDCCGTKYEYQGSDMGQTIPDLRSNADENPNLPIIKTKQEVIRMKFKDAPIGARFHFIGDDVPKEVFVKIHDYDDGLVVQWNGNVQGHQSHCCWLDKENGYDFDTEIELI